MTEKTETKNLSLKERVERLEKENNWLRNKVKEFEEDLNSYKQSIGGSQPSNQLRITKVVKKDNGQPVKVVGCKEIKELKEEIRKKDFLSTKLVRRFLRDKGHNLSKNQVRKNMRKIAEQFEDYEYIKGGATKSYKGGKQSKIAYNP